MSDPTAIKVVIAPPGDTTPPTNPVWTQDNMLGINPPVVNNPEFLTPYDFGCVGDGITDDTVNFQAFLDGVAGSVGYGKAGTFLISSAVQISSDTWLMGAGDGSFELTTPKGIDLGSTWLLWNKNPVADTALPPIDKNIRITGTKFTSDKSQNCGHDFIDFMGVKNLRISECSFENRRQDFILLFNCDNVWIENNYFTNSFGIPIFCISRVQDFHFNDNHIYDVGLGIWLPYYDTRGTHPAGNFAQCCGNILIQTIGTGISGSANYCNINDNVIYNVASEGGPSGGNGFELHGTHFNVCNNVVYLTGSAGIYLAQAQNVVVDGNQFSEVNFEAFEFIGAVTCNNFELGHDWGDLGCVNISITNNKIYNGIDRQGYAFMFLTNQDTSHLQENIVTANNSVNNLKSFTSGCFGYWSSALGLTLQENVQNLATCYNRGNARNLTTDPDNGPPRYTDLDPVTVQFKVPSGTLGTFQLHQVPFAASRIAFRTTKFAAVDEVCISIGEFEWYTFYPNGGFAERYPQNYQSSSTAWTTDAGGSYTKDFAKTACVSLIDGLGVSYAEAYVSARTSDGFVLTFANATTTDLLVSAACYP